MENGVGSMGGLSQQRREWAEKFPKVATPVNHNYSDKCYHRLSGRLWPDGRFSYGVVTSRERTPDLPPPDVAALPQWLKDGADAPACPLNLTNGSNSHTRAKRGKNGITAHGKAMLRSAGAILSRSRYRRRLTFATITLPDMERGQYSILVQRWGELLRQFVQWVGRQLASLELPRALLVATEVQPKREMATGFPALHLHCVWLNPSKRGIWTLSGPQVVEWVRAAIERLTGQRLAGHVSCNTQLVRKNAGAYLAKYMSKGCGHAAAVEEFCGKDIHPTTWWNMSGSLRRAVKECIVSGPGVAEMLEDVRGLNPEGNGSGVVRWCYPVEYDDGCEVRVVGYRGCLHEFAYRLVATQFGVEIGVSTVDRVLAS